MGPRPAGLGHGTHWKAALRGGESIADCRLTIRIICVGCAAALGLALAHVVAAQDAPGGVAAACSAKQKQQRQRAVTAYKKRMPKDRAAYFRKHKSKKLRAAFVKKQQARLETLQRALAACNKKTTTTTRPTTTTKTTTSSTTTTAPSPTPVRAEVGVSVTATRVGEELRWTFSVRNYGPGTAAGVTARVDVPAGATLVSAPTDCVGSPIVCSIGTLAPGTARDLPFAIRPPAAIGDVTLSARITSTTEDPTASNDVAALTMSVAPADVSLQKTVSHAERAVGRTATYTLTLRNA